jgi:NADH dehydrogenase [ubiquinone] 1 alpha subcomplex assembly factor 5
MLESLNPNGVLIGNIFGEDTLQGKILQLFYLELRIAFTLAESERSGGISPHISPFITIIELGNLLARSKFNLPTIY